MNHFKLEQRKCWGCSKTFKVMTSSKQHFCCKVCEESSFRWGDQKWVKKEEEKWQEKDIEKNGKIQNLEQRNMKEQKKEEKKLEKEIESNQRSNMSEIETYDLDNVGNGDLKIENDNLKPNENTMPDTKNDCKSLSTTEEKEETRPTVYTQQSEDSSMEIFQSSGLLDNLMKDSCHYIKGMFPKDQDLTIRAYEPEKVRAAAILSREVVSMMKIKLDAVKLKAKLEGRI